MGRNYTNEEFFETIKISKRYDIPLWFSRWFLGERYLNNQKDMEGLGANTFDMLHW
jgi:hypothetical protein